eukprot:g654.t1
MDGVRPEVWLTLLRLRSEWIRSPNHNNDPYKRRRIGSEGGFLVDESISTLGRVSSSIAVPTNSPLVIPHHRNISSNGSSIKKNVSTSSQSNRFEEEKQVNKNNTSWFTIPNASLSHHTYQRFCPIPVVTKHSLLAVFGGSWSTLIEQTIGTLTDCQIILSLISPTGNEEIAIIFVNDFKYLLTQKLKIEKDILLKQQLNSKKQKDIPQSSSVARTITPSKEKKKHFDLPSSGISLPATSNSPTRATMTSTLIRENDKLDESIAIRYLTLFENFILSSFMDSSKLCTSSSPSKEVYRRPTGRKPFACIALSESQLFEELFNRQELEQLGSQEKGNQSGNQEEYHRIAVKWLLRALSHLGWLRRQTASLDSNFYWISVPNWGKWVHAVLDGRRYLLGRFKRAKHNQLLGSDLTGSSMFWKRALLKK